MLHKFDVLNDKVEVLNNGVDGLNKRSDSLTNEMKSVNKKLGSVEKEMVKFNFVSKFQIAFKLADNGDRIKGLEKAGFK
ncbi:MAG: hypothetical protein AABY93_03120 [Bacteroidota bacterium]